MKENGVVFVFTPIGIWNVLCEWSAVVTAHLLLQISHAIFSPSAIPVPPCHLWAKKQPANCGRAQINVNNGQTSL